MTPAHLRVALLALPLALCGCTRRVPEAVKAGPPRVIQLLANVPDTEAERLVQRREDVEVDTRDFERTPRVVATGETPWLRLEGARARLFGDSHSSQGWSVHNFVLLEVIDQGGKVVGSAAIGFTESVILGKEQVDNIGRMSFTFEPGEVDITHKLPEHEPFKLRATVLDYSGVGKVSDVFLVLDSAGSPHRIADDDLRE